MTVINDVRAVSAALDAALPSNDATRIGGFMTDDWVHIGSTGVTPKADIIGWIASGRLLHHTMTVIGGERVAPVAGGVLLTAHKVSTGSWDGEPYTADEWISDFYVQTNGAWRCAFSQKTAALAD